MKAFIDFGIAEAWFLEVEITAGTLEYTCNMEYAKQTVTQPFGSPSQRRIVRYLVRTVEEIQDTVTVLQICSMYNE